MRGSVKVQKWSYVENPDDQTIKCSYVIYSAGTFGYRGWDKSFDFRTRKIKPLRTLLHTKQEY
jgi:hypothetical protein